MIDKKINDSLKELENSLRDIQSAKRQVERVVNSYGEANSLISSYVNRLGSLDSKVQNLIDSIGNDYQRKSAQFEKDQLAIIKSADAAICKLTKSVSEYRSSIEAIQKRLNYIMAFNVVAVIVIIAGLSLLLKYSVL